MLKRTYLCRSRCGSGSCWKTLLLTSVDRCAPRLAFVLAAPPGLSSTLPNGSSVIVYWHSFYPFASGGGFSGEWRIFGTGSGAASVRSDNGRIHTRRRHAVYCPTASNLRPWLINLGMSQLGRPLLFELSARFGLRPVVEDWSKGPERQVLIVEIQQMALFIEATSASSTFSAMRQLTQRRSQKY